MTFWRTADQVFIAHLICCSEGAEPTGFSEPPDCVSGVFMRLWPAVAEPERSAVLLPHIRSGCDPLPFRGCSAVQSRGATRWETCWPQHRVARCRVRRVQRRSSVPNQTVQRMTPSPLGCNRVSVWASSLTSFVGRRSFSASCKNSVCGVYILDIKRILIAVSVVTIVIVAGSTMYSASSSRRASERKLLRVWSAPGSSVEERAEAVNRGFPRGIPVSSVIALLGTNHTEVRLIGADNRGKAPGGFFTLTYGFGDGETVLIQATGPVNADPLGAGFYSAVGLIRGHPSARTRTSNPGESQPDGAANRGQPVGSRTNQTSPAAGPGG